MVGSTVIALARPQCDGKCGRPTVGRHEAPLTVLGASAATGALFACFVVGLILGPADERDIGRWHNRRRYRPGDEFRAPRSEADHRSPKRETSAGGFLK